MAKYRKKPVVIDAFCFGSEDEPDWFKYALMANKITNHPDRLLVHTLEGTMNAVVGDWIIRGTKGELYPCKPDIFAEIYEALEGN
jgi:hypothetical protein